MVGLSGESGASTEEIVNRMSSNLVRWTKEMVAHQLAKNAVKDMEDELAVLVDALKRVERYGHTPDGYSELTALHRRYLDHWRRFFPHFPQPKQSYYENIMGLIQAYCVSYVVVARVHIDYRKQNVEYKCGLRFPSQLRLSQAALNATVLTKRWEGDAVAKCQHAREDLDTAWDNVADHLVLLQDNLEQVVIPAVRTKFFGETFLFDANYKAMHDGVWEGPPLRGKHKHAYKDTAVSMLWDIQSTANTLFLDVQCEHRFSAAFTCKLERRTFPQSVIAMRNHKWPIYSGGISCLRKLEALTQQYRSGPMHEIEKFIWQSVYGLVFVLGDTEEQIAEESRAAKLWLNDQPAV
ncbi:hypothetical protein RI367_007887 [Sorochytrium milnesiophthora]